jgi:hypothetical protein
VITHRDANELLAAFALDAVPRDECERITAHLQECPFCHDELDALLRVAAAMANSIEPLPGGLWSRISSLLPVHHEHGRSTPALGADSRRRSDHIRRGQSQSHPRRRKSSRRRRTTLAGCAVAAAAITTALSLNVVSAGNHVAQLRREMSQSTNAPVRTALQAPGHKIVDLSGARHSELARFVLDPDGRGYLLNSGLPALSSQATYQLWGLINGRIISLGILGRSLHQVAFTVKGSPRLVRLGISIEPTGGSIQPSGRMLISGPV